MILVTLGLMEHEARDLLDKLNGYTRVHGPERFGGIAHRLRNQIEVAMERASWEVVPAHIPRHMVARKGEVAGLDPGSVAAASGAIPAR